MRFLIAFAVTIAAAAMSFTCPAMELYVDPVNGDDSNDGSSWGNALKTITKAGELSETLDTTNIHLAEGLFSEDTGEVFPITLYNLESMSGVSRDKTVIDVGLSLGIFVFGGVARGDDDTASIETLCISRSGPVDYHEYSDPAAFTEIGRYAYLELRDVHLLGLRSGGYYSQHIYEGELTELRFLHCLLTDSDIRIHAKAGWLYYVGFLDSVFVYTTDFGPNQPYVEIYPKDSAWLCGCRFRSIGEYPAHMGLVSAGYNDTPIFNCAFEDMELDFYGGWRKMWIVGCTFRSSLLEVGTDYNDVWIQASILDDDTELRSGLGGPTRIMTYQTRLTPDIILVGDFEIIGSHPLEGNPQFVPGPLGDLYLSNASSGQTATSCCVGEIEHPATYFPEAYEYLTGPWPPTGTTTRTDGTPDAGYPYDAGYHYPSVAPPPPALHLETDRAEYSPGDEMILFGGYENRGVKVEGAIYAAFGPQTLDWLVYWPSMTFDPAPVSKGIFYSGVALPTIPLDTLTVPDALQAGNYAWLGLVLNSDGSLASDLCVSRLTIRPQGGAR